jgi:transcriptional regulator with XRE-family HTH domain
MIGNSRYFSQPKITMTFRQNLKYFRKRKGLTQVGLASVLGITRASVGAYEEGRAEPPYVILQRMCKALDTTYAQILSEHPETQDLEFAMGAKLRLLSIAPKDEGPTTQAFIVPAKAAAGYLQGYAQPEFVASLPQVNLPLPALKGKGTLRIFEIEGDSMWPLPSGALMITSFVQDWTKLKGKESCIVVGATEGIVFKRVSYESGTLHLQSTHPDYKPFIMPVSEVREIWRALGYISLELPEGVKTKKT